MAGLVRVNFTYWPVAVSCTASRPDASEGRLPWAKDGPMIVPLVLALSASYSVNGTVAPVPLGTLNGDWAQYGGVPAWASAGVATATASTVPSPVITAAASATIRVRRLAPAGGPPGGL